MSAYREVPLAEAPTRPVRWRLDTQPYSWAPWPTERRFCRWRWLAIVRAHIYVDRFKRGYAQVRPIYETP